MVTAPTPLPCIYRGHSDPGFFASALNLPGDPTLISLAPGNEIPPSGPYACLVPTLAFHSLLRDPSSPDRWHYSDLESEIIRDLRNKRAVLILDLCNEGPSFHPPLMQDLYAWLGVQQIPLSRCVWLSQNRAIERAARAEFAAGADHVSFLSYDYFIKMTAWKFAHSGDEHPLGEAKWDVWRRLFDGREKDRLLLCLNATPRHHRILALAGLDYHGVLEDSLYSFPGCHYVKPSDDPKALLQYLANTPALRHLLDACTRRVESPPIRIDDFSETGNELVFKMDPTHYLRTYFSLVTETEFSEGNVERVTEKTAKALAVGHPTIVMGNAKSLHFMSELGFQEWSAVLDPAYDSIGGNIPRFSALMNLITKTRDDIQANPEKWLSTAREIGQFNYSFANGGRFLMRCRKRLDEPVVQAIWALLHTA